MRQQLELTAGITPPLVLLMALIPLLPALMMAVGSVLIQLKILVLRSPVP